MEASEGKDWGWYSPQQIPSLIGWLETGSREEQQLAEQIYAMYQPVLKIVMHPKQVSGLRTSPSPVVVSHNLACIDSTQLLAVFKIARYCVAAVIQGCLQTVLIDRQAQLYAVMP